jgi:hypothetical protein
MVALRRGGNVKALKDSNQAVESTVADKVIHQCETDEVG